MEAFLTLQKGGKHYLLVADSLFVHIITVNRRLNEQTRGWLVAQTRSIAAMNEKQLSRLSVARREIENVVLTGYGAGSRLELRMNRGRKSYLLSDGCTPETAQRLFAGMKLLHGDNPGNTEEKKPRTVAGVSEEHLKVAGYVANYASLACGILLIFYRRLYPFLCAAGFACIAVCFALYLLFPRYYTLLERKREHGEKKRVRPDELYTGMMISAAGMLAAVLGSIAVLDLVRVAVISAAVTAVLAVLVWWRGSEMRTAGRMLSFVIICWLLAAMPLTAANVLLDTSAGETCALEVVELNVTNSTKSGKHYSCEVVMDNGRKIYIPLSMNEYWELEVGETVDIVVRDGALGIPYAEIER